MFKPGQKIVCIIDDGYDVRKGETYTFDFYSGTMSYISIIEDSFHYHQSKYFISTQEYRKQKLKEICSNQEIE
jgi:hypothetical protein